MKVLYDWLKEFTYVTLAPAELRERLSLAGTAVEGLAETAAGPLLGIDLTINRPDLLGHYGVAREVATLERRPFGPKFDPKLTEAAGRTADAIQVAIECPDLCGRYTARVVRGVKVRPSPDWLRRRLEALGQASINNVVDVTNYVMLELGQPLHAFDLDRLSGPRIIVRRSRAGEKLKTLDGIERALPADTCVIADASHGVAIGGIMGGAESEISAATRNVLIEAAWFDPLAIRRASKALGLRTEASLRFERGADAEMAEMASRRCAELISDLKVSGGEVLGGVIDLYPAKRAPLSIRISRREILRVLGADVPDGEIEAILGSLGFAPQRANASAIGDVEHSFWVCTQPSWRQDVTREIDLIEEVARHYGLEHFPPRMPAARRPAARLPHAEAEDRLRERLMGLGYQEIATIPLVNEEEDALFRRSHAVPVRIANPLAEDSSVMRSNGLINMAQALTWNLNRGQRNLRLFEISRIYGWNDGVPREMRILSMGATGAARQKGPFESERAYAFADLKGDLDQIGDLAGGFAWNASSLESWQHPAQAGRIALVSHTASVVELSGAYSFEIGIAAKVGSRVAERLKFRQDVFLGGFWLDPFYAAVEAARAARRYQLISRFPAVERDFSLTLDEGASFAAVRRAIEELKIPEITGIEAVDLFRGKTIPAGKFSLLVRVTFQSQETTLTETQVGDYAARIVAALEQRLGAALRST